MNKLNSLLTVIISLLFGAFVGMGAGAWLHYKTFEELYVEQSAPWYFKLVGILVGLLVAAIICMLLKIPVRRRCKEKKEKKEKELREKEQAAAAEQQEN